MKRACSSVLMLALMIAPAPAATLYSFGPDLNNGDVPDNFTQIGAGAIGPQSLVGDGSIGFDGGLVYDPSNSSFYSIGNSTAGPALYSFVGGAPDFVGSLDPNVGWFFGLTLDTDNGAFYAIGDDSGIQSLYTVDEGGAHFVAGVDSGIGPYSGIAYDPDTSLFYAIALNFTGGPDAVYSFGALGGTPEFLLALDGFGGSHLGGLAYGGSGVFYSIESVGDAEAMLLSFNLSNGILTGPTDLNAVGFENHGIAAILPAQSTPEPATGWIVGVGVLAAGLWRRRHEDGPEEA